MKKLMTLAMALAVVTFAASCSSSSKSNEESDESEMIDTLVSSDGIDVPAEEVAPEPQDDGVLAKLQPEDIKLPADLKGVVEVINGENGYIAVTMDEHHYPTVDITLKLLKTIDTGAFQNSYGQFWLYGEPQDAQGRTVKDLMPNYGEWRSDDGDGSMIKNFLEGEPEETITFSYSGENNIELFEKDQTKIDAGMEKTSAACKKVAKFKLFLKSDI